MPLEASAATASTSHATRQRNTSRIDSYDAGKPPQFAYFVLSGYGLKTRRLLLRQGIGAEALEVNHELLAL